jgi:hypothetical protein
MNKIKYVAVSIIIVAVLFVSWLVGFSSSKTTTKDVLLKGATNKKTIVLGEPITIEFEFINESEIPIRIPGLGVETGFLKVFIAPKGEMYKRYTTYGWGLILVPGRVLEAKQFHKYKEATILWNPKPDYSHLNPSAAKEADKIDNRVLTDYAFPEAGTYLIKATVTYCLSSGTDCSDIESEPIEIIVNKPTGNDLEVWEIMKENPEVGLFIQSAGGAFGTNPEKDKQTVEKVGQILNQYPDSFYAQSLRQSLDKFKANEEKRKANLEKMKQQKQPQ